MNDSIKPRIRRMVILGILAMTVILLALPVWGTSRSSASRESYPPPLYQGSVLSKNNLPDAMTQDLDAGSASALKSLSQENEWIASAGFLSPAGVHTTAVPAPESGKEKKMVYLTFDDGPSAVTPKVLEILRQQGVKATFFVLGEQAKTRPELINAIWEQGHAIGNHTYNHNYHELYSGFTTFWGQIKQTEEIVREITGVRPQLVRAPGGTFGHFDNTYFYLLKQAGYSVMDWNVDSGDSKRKGVPAQEIIRESVQDSGASQVVLLLHDGAGHGESAKALPGIIEHYKAAGYGFGIMDERMKPVQFKVSGTAGDASRKKPSSAWIASHIIPNADLFAPGKPLIVKVGMQEIKLKAGEYRVSGGRYIVPIRAVIERLGGQISWDAASRSGRMIWNGRSVTADAGLGELRMNLPSGAKVTRAAGVQMIGSSLWVPLRELLDVTGHPPLGISVTGDERRVQAL